MASNMELEQEDDRPIDGERTLVHPLAIVNMSDQYTRIRSGGSPLPPNAPVTGLLFGTRSTTAAATAATGSASSASFPSSSSSSSPPSLAPGTVLELRDAEDIPVDLSEPALLQEALHRAVFPSNRVVGWYRVGETEEVLESDVVLTQSLADHYLGHQQPQQQQQQPQQQQQQEQPFVFALLVISNDDPNRKPPPQRSFIFGFDQAEPDTTEGDEEAPLPLSLFKRTDGALQHVPDWTLETLDSERIAVERVLRERPRPRSSAAAARATTTTAAATQSSSSNNSFFATMASAEYGEGDGLDSSRFLQHAQGLDQSVHAMSRRLDVLRSFLEDTAEGLVPFQPSLVRQVNSVLLHAAAIQQPTPGPPPTLSPAFSSSFAGPNAPDRRGMSSTSSPSPSMMIPIAHLLKTAESVRCYTDKFRVVQEAAATSAATGGGGFLAPTSVSSRIRERDLKGY